MTSCQLLTTPLWCDPRQLDYLRRTSDALWVLDAENRVCTLVSTLTTAEATDIAALQQRPVETSPYIDFTQSPGRDYLDAVNARQPYRCDQFIFTVNFQMPGVFCLRGFPWFDSAGVYCGYITTIVDAGDSGIMKVIRQHLLEETRLLAAAGACSPLIAHLDTTAKALYRVLNTDLVLISIVQQDKMQSLTLCLQGSIVPSRSYCYDATPCGQTLAQGQCVVERGLQGQFPGGLIEQLGMASYAGLRLDDISGNPIGVICCFNRQPLVGAGRVLNVLRELSLMINPYVRNYLDARRMSEQDLVLRQAYSMAKVGAWLHYPRSEAMPQLSPEAGKIWGLDGVGQLTLAQVYQRIHPDDRQLVAYNWNHVQALGQYATEYRVIDESGRIRWLSEQAQAEFDGAGAYIRAIGVIQDITAQKRSEEQLRTMSYAVFESSNIVFTIDQQTRILDCNPAFELCTGYCREDVIGRPSAFLNAEEVPRSLYWGVWRTLLRGQEWRGEMQNRRRNGETYWVKAAITPVKNNLGQIISYLCVYEDITERRQQEAQLRHQAFHDGLTNLPNRQQLQQLLSARLGSGEAASLLFIDLDGFKHVNDSLGHEVGDELLQRVARRLVSGMQPQDVVARLGGDEFVVMLLQATQPEVAAERILAVLHYPFEVRGRTMHLGASIGIVVAPEDGDTAEVLLRNADAAMYHAKSNGKNTWKRFSSDIYEDSTRRLVLENSLRQAIKQGELQLYYQPQQMLHTGNIYGAEALSRWFSPQLGEVSPQEFIPLAEEIGLIDELGDWVVREALSACRIWRESGLPQAVVSINVSPRQFRNAHLLNTISQTLAELSMPASALCVEVTESLLMEDYVQAEDILRRLRDHGVRLAIDDFGVGYSSLSYLKRFPFHNLKIDRSFIGDIDKDEGDRTLVRTIIQMAHNLGLSVVAEGVENTYQYQLLMGMGCESLQGFWFSKPLPQQDFLQLICTWRGQSTGTS